MYPELEVKQECEVDLFGIYCFSSSAAVLQADGREADDDVDTMLQFGGRKNL